MERSRTSVAVTLEINPARGWASFHAWRRGGASTLFTVEAVEGGFVVAEGRGEEQGVRGFEAWDDAAAAFLDLVVAQLVRHLTPHAAFAEREDRLVDERHG